MPPPALVIFLFLTYFIMLGHHLCSSRRTIAAAAAGVRRYTHYARQCHAGAVSAFAAARSRARVLSFQYPLHRHQPGHAIKTRSVSSSSSMKGSHRHDEQQGRSVSAAAFDERVSLAPMMEYTDRHFRFLLRQLSSRMVMYTEMVAANTLVYNEEARDRFLCYNDPVEHPVVLQLGGADPSKLASACAIADPYRYDAINLNCGCPSSKVAGSGCFGAALMREPALVADLCRAMASATDAPITVKHRIGVDDQESYEELCRFVDTVASTSPVRHFIVHARKALLNGISPEANRKIPPLKYDYVYRLVKDFPELDFTLNGGVLSYEDVEEHLRQGVAGVMIGRAITARPYYWSDVDQRIYGDEGRRRLSRREVMERYMQYAEKEEDKAAGAGIKIRRQLAKHVHHMFAGEANGKRFRAVMDRELLNTEAGIRQVIETAMRVISPSVLDDAPSSYDTEAPEAVRH